MANTVNYLSYANTFGEWMVNTNLLAHENNDLAAGNYTKNTGLLTLNSPNVSVQVSNTALFTGNALFTGTGTAIDVTNDVEIGGDLNVGANTTITDTATIANLVVTDSVGGTAIIRFRQQILDEALAMSIALS